MNELPKGWAFAQLPELITNDGIFIDGDWVESKDQDPDGDVRLIQLADVGDGFFLSKSNRFLTQSKAKGLGCTFLKKGDVLVARMPDPLGRACIFPGDKKVAVTVVDVCVIRGRLDHFDNLWLMYFINSPAFRESIHALQSGSTRKRISRGNLSTLKLPVPPRSEQTRIVEKLEELLSDLDAGIAELKAAQKKLVKYRQALLKAAVEGTLTADWRKTNQPKETGAQLLERILEERRSRWEAKQLAKFQEQGKTPPKGWQDKYPEPVQSYTANLPTLPDGWVWATIDQLSLEQKYGSSSKTGSDSSGVPVIRMGNIQDGELDLQNLKYLPQDHNEFPVLYLADGDLLFNRTNSPELVGKTAVFRSQIIPCSYASYLIAVRFSPWFIPELAASYINSGFGRLWIKSVVTQQVGQANVNGTKLAALAIPLPPAEEQSEIVRLLQEQRKSSFEQSSNIEHSLKQLAVQRKNILKAAFSGQLAPQDPNDEPASVLLERIRAGRAAIPNAVKTRIRRK